MNSIRGSGLALFKRPSPELLQASENLDKAERQLAESMNKPGRFVILSWGSAGFETKYTGRSGDAWN
ncbi:MAG: hypothetical protein KBD16_01605 [Candidatus Pacebacteria bacterium]|nr:hypothetical protein [Candidatus Paceibacterota bacterium]